MLDLFDRIKEVLDKYDCIYYIDKYEKGYSIKVLRDSNEMIRNIIKDFKNDKRFKIEIVFENNKCIRFRVR